MKEKKTIPEFRRSREKLCMVTAYDYLTAMIVDRAGVDMILVGDSLGMVFQGNDNTLGVTLDQMIYHCKAVARGRERALVIGDMPYMTYHINVEESVRNAGRMIQEAGIDAVKLEGGRQRTATVRRMVEAEIPVMGHIGLTPQSIHSLGGFKVQGICDSSRQRLQEDALALQDAGVFSLVLECVPFDLAQEITESLEIPTIGIGAGPFCRGQVLVTEDLVGLTPQGGSFKFVRQFSDLGQVMKDAVATYCSEVRSGSFPKMEESFKSKRRRVS